MSLLLHTILLVEIVECGHFGQIVILTLVGAQEHASHL